MHSERSQIFPFSLEGGKVEVLKRALNAEGWGLIGCSFTGRPAVKNMPLCQWRAATRGRKPSGDGAQPMATRGGLRVLLHWAGPSGGEPWVTFTEATLTAEDVCIHIAHKVGESWPSAP